MDHSHLPPHRKRTADECRATALLMGEGYYYGDKAHIIVYIDERASAKSHVDADTLEPLTPKQVSIRLEEWKEWCNSQKTSI